MSCAPAPAVMRPPLVALILALSFTVAAQAQAPREKGHLGLPVERLTEQWTGDLDGMLERRAIRILTVYSRTLFFVDGGVPRGTAYDQGKLLEEVATPDEGGRGLLNKVAERFGLSARGYHRVLRVARTIADLDGSEDIRQPHVAEAVSFRLAMALPVAA